MITRRRFISITMMILALFVLFQGPQFIREQYNDYETNSYYTKRTFLKSDVWNQEESANEEIIVISNDSDLISDLEEWTFYTKRKITVVPNISDAEEHISDQTACAVISPEIWDQDGFEDRVSHIMSNGISVVFSKLPDFSRMSDSKAARALVGIDSIRMDNVHVDGLRLFDGFFLGGERIFMPQQKQDEKRQDLDLDMPWYRTGAGAETFMMGIFENDEFEGEELKNEELPPVIWSCGHENAKTYSVQGDYMDDRYLVMGIMSAVMADINPVELYPVVNSQQLQILNFPSLSDENKDVLMNLYSRSLTQFERNIVYPGIVADTDGNGFNLTAYIMPQYDYFDDAEPKNNELTWYLSQLNEQKAELGYSLVHQDNISLAEKVETDLRVLNKEAGNYKFASIYAEAADAKQAIEQLPNTMSESVNTICTENLEEFGIVDFLTDEVTVQQSTATVNSYTYFNDLQMLSAETALGYASISIDMQRVLWPQKEEDQWQNASKEIFSVVDTYWQNFRMFAKTTASETDRNIRNLLVMNYKYELDQDTIHLKADHFSGSVSFVLRTHNKKIQSVSNGNYERIEQDAYLVTTEDSSCDIVLEDDFNMRK